MAELVIRISGDIKNYEEAMDKASKETEGLNDTLESVAKKSAIAFAALTAEIGLSVAAYKESEQAINKLSASMQAQGIFSRNLLESYKNQATELQRLTGLSDEAFLSAQTTIQGYLGQTEVTKELTLAITNFSVAQGVDLASAADLVGKSISTSSNVLKRYGIDIGDATTKSEKLESVIEQLNARYEGQAEAAGKGLGSLNKLKETFGDLQEEIGARFAPLIERATVLITSFIEKLKDNEGIVNLIARLLGAAAAITGLTAVFATLGTVILSAKAALIAFGIAGSVALGPIAIAAAAIVAAAGALGYFAVKSAEAGPKSKDLGEQISSLNEEIDRLNERLEKNKKLGLTTLADKELAKSVEQKKRQVDQLEQQYERQIFLEQKAAQAAGGEQNKALQKAAEDRAAAEARKESLLFQARSAGNKALLLEAQRASQEQIKLKQEESALLKQLAEEDNAANRAAIQQKLEDNRTLQAAANETAKEEGAVFNEQLLAQNEEFEALSDEQKQEFLLKNQATLQAQVDTENEVRQKAAADKFAIQTKEDNDFLANQQKFGTAYALINKIMHSAVVQGSAQAFGELAALQQSSNATLKGIGKFAAASHIAIKTAESAMNIYAGFSTIPIVGPALGVAGAAAAVAFGAEQIGKVNAAADGGLLEGGIPGVDSIPVLAQQGELVVPRRNFDEVVDAVAAQRAGTQGEPQQTSAAPGPIEIVLSLKDNLMDFIEAQSNEREALGVSLRVVQS